MKIELAPNEKIVFFIRRHWASFLNTILLLIAMILLPLVGFLIAFFIIKDIFSYPIIKIVFLFFSAYYLFVALFFLVSWVDYYFDLLIVTNERLIKILQVGILNREFSELHLLRIQNVTGSVSGILQTIFNFGNVDIETAGREEHFECFGIPRPYEVAKNILKLHEDLVNREKHYEHIAEGELKYETPPKRLGEMMVNEGYITNEHLQEALDEQKITGERLGSIFVRKGFISESDLLNILSAQHQLPVINLEKIEITQEVLDLIPKNIAEKYLIVPINKFDSVVTIAMASPRDKEIIEDIASMINCTVIPVVASENAIKKAIEKYY
jgi:membrane protein YdbS with pleckstrin-like domain